MSTCRPQSFVRFGEAALSALVPRPRVDGLEWACRHVLFPVISSATQSLYNVRAYPWVRGLWDAAQDATITHITMVWAAQLGKTSFETAYLAFRAANDPVPTLIGGPDKDACRSISVNKIQPVLRASPETAALLPPEHLQKDLEIDLRWQKVFFGWSGSPATLGEKSIGLVIKQELDKWSTKASAEGDPANLVEERVKDFVDFLIIQDSTPTEEGTSRICAQYEQSDRRTYRVPCPHCGAFGVLEWENVELPHDANGRVAPPDVCLHETRYVCPHCRVAIDDARKVPMARDGVWARDGEGVTPDGAIVVEDKDRVRRGSHAGFHLSSLISPKLTWGRIGEAWSRALIEGSGAVRNFVNGWLARPFSPHAKVTAESEVLAHTGADAGLGYAKDTCPVTPIVVLFLVDVQEDCLWYASWAVGAGKTLWLLRCGQLPKDLPSCLALQGVTFTGPGGDGPDGEPFRHTHALIDSGYRTQAVYQFARDHDFTVTKGYDSAAREQPLTLKTMPNGVTMLGLRVLDFKDALVGRIKSDNLTEPGCWRLYETCGREFARQMTAEKRIVETDRFGKRTPRWVRTRDDNHYWDLSVMALGAIEALEMQGTDFYRDPGAPGSRGRGPRMAGRRRKFKKKVGTEVRP